MYHTGKFHDKFPIFWDDKDNARMIPGCPGFQEQPMKV